MPDQSKEPDWNRIDTLHPGSDKATRPFQALGAISADRDRGLLIEMSGADLGRVHRLAEPVITIGRGQDCTLRFEDATLSRVHARIFRDGDDFVVEDAGSLNGTWLNQQPVRRHMLADGDRMRLGSGLLLQFLRVGAVEEDALSRLYEAGVMDALTGLCNRRNLLERLEAELAHAVRHGRELCLLMLDIDHFKRVNDTHGHLAGDEVLRQVAQALAAKIRKGDFLARYGGEELVVVARDTSLEGAAILAERLRAAVEALVVPYEDRILRVTTSIGVASLATLGDAPFVVGLIAQADEELYRAKHAGRNRVSIAGLRAAGGA
jgi:diguanylate cyclase (GGDEF)-like protein